MKWLSFDKLFDHKPKQNMTISYPKGSVLPVPDKAAAAALAAGVATEVPQPDDHRVHVDGIAYQVYRVDPQTGEETVIASGLDHDAALAMKADVEEADEEAAHPAPAPAPVPDPSETAPELVDGRVVRDPAGSVVGAENATREEAAVADAPAPETEDEAPPPPPPPQSPPAPVQDGSRGFFQG